MIEPTQIVEESDHEVSIKWSDDTETRYTARQLRMECPCAGCINEWTGEKILDNSAISEDINFKTDRDSRPLRTQFPVLGWARYWDLQL